MSRLEFYTKIFLGEITVRSKQMVDFQVLNNIICCHPITKGFSKRFASFSAPSCAEVSLGSKTLNPLTLTITLCVNETVKSFGTLKKVENKYIT